jgi:thiamine pyrophosphate-dependent acetolactate synthase large subunit-like protein
MTEVVTRDTGAEGAAEPAGLTDGIHLVVDALKLNGVENIYGVVGIPITDLARLAQASGIRYIGFRHESDAAHAAAATLREALAAGVPALIDCAVDPSDGTESGAISHLNPKGLAAKR